MKKIGLFFAFFYILGFVSAQNTAEMDSILSVLQKNKKEDTNRVNSLIELGRLYVNSIPDTSVLILNEAKKIADKLDYLKGQTEYYIYSSSITSNKNPVEHRDSFTKVAVHLATKLKNKAVLGSAYNQRGNYYKLIAKHDSAIFCFLIAKNNFEEIKNYKKLTAVLNNLCYQYISIGDLNKAEKTGLEALALAEQHHTPYKGDLLGMLGIIYTNQFNHIKAEKYFKESIKVATENNNTYSVIGNTSNLITCLGYQKKYKEILPIAIKNYDVSVAFGDPENIQIALITLGSAYYYNKQFDEAEKTIYSDIKFRKENNIYIDFHQDYVLLTDIAIAQHQFGAADSLRAIGDSIKQAYVNDEIRNSTLDLEKKYESQKKEKQILALEKQKQARNFWIIMLVFFLLAAFILSYFIFRYFNQKKIIAEQQFKQLQQEKKLEATQTILRTQEEERTRVAKDLHDGLGGMLSGIKLNLSAMKGNVILQEQDAFLYSKSIEQLDSAISEMRRVAHNMMPETLLKFGLLQAVEDYCESINDSNLIHITFKNFGLDKRIESSTEVILYRIIQELVNNAIKHSKAQHLFIQLIKNDSQLTLTVEDNGIGFDIKEIQQLKGFGINSIQSRVDYLNGNLEIDTSKNIGTTFNITIPL